MEQTHGKQNDNINAICVSAKRYVAYASKEVILSAGAFNSPALLQLSGIGDEKHLKSLGIKAVVSLPDVGRNLQDHPVMFTYFEMNTTHTFDPIFRGEDLSGVSQWVADKSGIGSSLAVPHTVRLSHPRNR